MRKLAEELRLEAARRIEDRRTKCAQIVSAASALELLRRKIGGPDVA